MDSGAVREIWRGREERSARATSMSAASRRPKSAKARQGGDCDREAACHRGPVDTRLSALRRSSRPSSAVPRAGRFSVDDHRMSCALTDTNDDLEQYQRPNLFVSHARRLRTLEPSSARRGELDEQLEELARAMRQPTRRSQQDRRADEMAAHLRSQQRQAESLRAAAELGYDKRRMLKRKGTIRGGHEGLGGGGAAGNQAGEDPGEDAEDEAAVPFKTPSQRMEEALRARAQHASAHSSHEVDTEADAWLEEMWVARRTQAVRESRHAGHVQRALQQWEREKQRREEDFERKAEARRADRSSKLRLLQGAGLSDDVGDDVGPARAHGGARPGPVRQHSAGRAEDLKRAGLIAASRPRTRERSNSFAQVEQVLFRQPPMRFKLTAPQHLSRQRKIVRAVPKPASAAPGSADAGRLSPRSAALAAVEAQDASEREDAESQRQKQERRRRTSRRCLLHGREDDNEYIVHENERLARQPRSATRPQDSQVPARSSEAEGKTIRGEGGLELGLGLGMSCVNERQMNECKAILARCKERGLASSMDALKRVLVTPADKPAVECVRNLPVPGSTLPRKPGKTVASSSSAAAKTKKGKKKGKKSSTATKGKGKAKSSGTKTKKKKKKTKKK